MKKNAFYAQSGGVTSVINASACGVIESARKNKNYDRLGKKPKTRIKNENDAKKKRKLNKNRNNLSWKSQKNIKTTMDNYAKSQTNLEKTNKQQI